VSVSVHRIVDARDRRGGDFVCFPQSIYGEDSLYVPWFRGDVQEILDRKHPFFEHSDGAFFLASRGDRPLGRVAALEPRRFNRYRGRREAWFSLFDSVEDPGVSEALFAAAADWARERGLDRMVGPRGLSGMNGGGILVEGFQHPPAMTMMAYNHPYYGLLAEDFGFRKRRDFFSAWLDGASYRTPEKITRVAEIALKRGAFRIAEIRTKKDLAAAAREIGGVYNESWGDHDDFCPLTGKELARLVRGLLLVSDPGLIKVIMKGDEAAGFCLTFPDLTPSLRAARGKPNLPALLRILREKKRTRRFVINGIGVLPRFRNSGGTAVIYRELERTLKGRDVLGADMTQIAETTDLMLKDMETLGGRVYKTHRVYERPL